MDASEQSKRSSPGEEQQKRNTGGSSGGPEREVERLNERGRKPMKNNFHRWGGRRTSIASETLLPTEPPMGSLGTGKHIRSGNILSLASRHRLN